jgi:hypothetical protein
MEQIQLKRRRTTTRWPEPLPLDPRDPDIVRAKRFAHCAGSLRRVSRNDEAVRLGSDGRSATWRMSCPSAGRTVEIVTTRGGALQR